MNELIGILFIVDRGSNIENTARGDGYQGMDDLRLNDIPPSVNTAMSSITRTSPDDSITG
jgi:hypothetical protein